ncbi:MAG TPA: FG-GAP-like repeat-containing protein, partial [Chitinophagaceae bacterium]|nr:FG-GAP-like repeat-containing protein [Chitinophagaceae bacterium]
PFGFTTTFPTKNSIASSDFAAVQNFTAGTAPSGLSIADIDGDGKADIVAANNASGSISILRNTSTSGSISFAGASNVTTSSDPFAVAVSDIDNDGKPDLVVANSYLSGFAGIGNTVTIYRNTSSPGSISFAAGVSFSTGNEPYDIAIGDINGDGKPDLAIANYNNGSGATNDVSILRNTSTAGSISFAAQTNLTTTKVAGGIGLGDIDGDGKPDLAVSNSGIFGNYGTSVSVYLNTTTTGSTTLSFGTKADFSTGASPYPVSFADIDGDGKNDLVTANFADDNMTVLRNTSVSGTISFAAQSNFATGDGNSYLGIGDLDGDGMVDVAVVNFGSSSTGNTVSVLRNASTSGTISFNAKVDLTTGTAPYKAAVGDLDGDGRADIAVSNYGTTNNGTTVSVFRTTPQGVLPLKLLSFTAKLINNNKVELDWQTDDEQNVNVYQAEWSSDSRNWQQIAEVPARNNEIKNDYSCFHEKLSPVNFYRIKMKDIDGRFTYSEVLKISTTSTDPIPVVYPNPAKNNITITGLDNKPVLVKIMSSKGEVVLQKNISVTATTMDISNFSRGLYLIQVIKNGKTFLYKLEKE